MSRSACAVIVRRSEKAFSARTIGTVLSERLAPSMLRDGATGLVGFSLQALRNVGPAQEEHHGLAPGQSPRQGQ